MRLVGDVGGTNVRFACADKQGNITNIKNYLKSDYNNICDAVNAYKKDLSVVCEEVYLAVNAPVRNDKPFINHNNWGYDVDCFLTEFDVKKVMFFNDLQAHAMSLPFLKADEKVLLNGQSSDLEGNLAVVGPGTGLGLAFGLYDKQSMSYKFNSSEGGNQLASGCDEKQQDVIAKIKTKKTSVRFEDVCSGNGLVVLYEALHDIKIDNKKFINDLKDADKKAVEVFVMFCEFLGTFMHNVGAAFLPSGGLYIIGGILADEGNLELLKKTKFLEYYFSKEFYNTDYLATYPIYIVKHKNPALLGLANAS